MFEANRKKKYESNNAGYGETMDDNVRNRRADFKVLKTTDEVGGGLFY